VHQKAKLPMAVMFICRIKTKWENFVENLTYIIFTNKSFGLQRTRYLNKTETRIAYGGNVFLLDLTEMRKFCWDPHMHYLYQLPNHWTSSFRGEDIKSFSQSETRISHGGHDFLLNWDKMMNFCRGPHKHHFCKVWFILA
jgi:hypothetical protein